MLQNAETSLPRALRTTLVSSLLLVQAAALRSWAQPAPDTTPSVLVIGAGISGLAAATKLKESGFQVTLLEARDRIGGRIKTDESLGLPVDLGASWIHGLRGNPLTLLVRKLGLKLFGTDYEAFQLRSGTGRPYTEVQRKTAAADYRQFEEFLSERQDRLPNSSSLQDAVDEFKCRQGLSGDRLALFEHRVGANIEQEYAADLSDLSAKRFDSDSQLPGGDALIEGGYGRIVSELARGLDIRLKHPVTRIEHGAIGAVVTSGGGVFRSDYAICTVPLGVLKAGAIAFVPELTPRKKEAIRRLGIGHLEKVALKFDANPFGPSPMIEIVNPRRRSVWSSWLHLAPRPGAANVLVAFAPGSFGSQLHRLSESQIIDQALAALRRAFRDVSIPRPLAAIVSDWKGDPYSLGAYSYFAVGADGREHAILAEPASPSLFFAGEHTHTRFPATAHGAYLSGIREAERIMALHKTRRAPLQK